MGNISLKDQSDICDAVEKLATSLKAQYSKTVEDLPDNNVRVTAFIEKDDWGVEVLIQEGWAYVHGYKALNGIGTNIDNIEDLPQAVERLRATLSE